jgi:hypothetical protein
MKGNRNNKQYHYICSTQFYRSLCLCVILIRWSDINIIMFSSSFVLFSPSVVMRLQPKRNIVVHTITSTIQPRNTKSTVISIENYLSSSLDQRTYHATASPFIVTDETTAVTLNHIEFQAPPIDQHSVKSRPPAIFLHGLLGNKRNFATIARSLSAQLDHQRAIYGLDLRNHGTCFPVSSTIGRRNTSLSYWNLYLDFIPFGRRTNRGQSS